MLRKHDWRMRAAPQTEGELVRVIDGIEVELSTPDEARLKTRLSFFLRRWEAQPPTSEEFTLRPRLAGSDQGQQLVALPLHELTRPGLEVQPQQGLRVRRP